MGHVPFLQLAIQLQNGFTTEKELKSGTVVPPGRRLPSGRAPLGSGGGDLESGNRAKTVRRPGRGAR